MPKIIENAREQLLEEAKRQIKERGYAATTVRSVANGCSVAVGTVYNYFSSKEMLVASFMAEDWLSAVKNLKAEDTDTPKTRLLRIYELLVSYSSEHSELFSDADAEKVFSIMFAKRHGQLRSQIAKMVLPVFEMAENAENAVDSVGSVDSEDKQFLSEFVAEALLTWTGAGIGFEQLYSVISKII